MVAASLRWLPIVAVAVAACRAPIPRGGHAIRFDLVREPPASTVTEQKSYFLWGLVPTRKVDVLSKCPYGVTAIIDGGRSSYFPTLGLWSRRATTYHCRAPRPVS